jgi:hypothetical protein
MKHACKTHRQTLFAFWFRSWDMDSMKKNLSFSQLNFRDNYQKHNLIFSFLLDIISRGISKPSEVFCVLCIA